MEIESTSCMNWTEAMYTLASYDESGCKYAKDCVPAMLDLIHRSLVIIGS